MSDIPTGHDAKPPLQGPPAGYFVVVPPAEKETDVDLVDLFWIALRGWKILFLAAFVGALIAIVVSYQMRKIYRAETLVAVVAQNGAGGAGALRGQLGGLAALAGIDIGAAGGRREESFATLASSGFVRDFIVQEKLMPILFAERWDAENNRWRDDGKKPPTLEAGVRKFSERVRSVKEDRKNGLITVAIEWESPELAARWANLMVSRVNDRLRAEAIRNSGRSIEYLDKELEKTNVIELRQAIYRLIEEQVKTAMLANVQSEYAFRVIDSAVPPEFRVWPKRALMAIVGFVLGGLLGLVIVFVRNSRRADL